MKPDRDGQKAVVALFRSIGATVYPTNQRRKSGLPKGLPDLIILRQPWGVLFWECKAPKGKLSEAQVDFQKHCFGVGAWYRSGGLIEAERFLEAQGVLLTAHNAPLVLSKGGLAARLHDDLPETGSTGLVWPEGV